MPKGQHSKQGVSKELKTTAGRQIAPRDIQGRLKETFEQLTSDQLLNLPAGELAQKFGCSQRHLNRLFHEHFGHSVAAFRMEMRLTKATALLHDHNQKLICVAMACGFSHLGLFNRCFKQKFGVSPARWRKADIQPGEIP